MRTLPFPAHNSALEQTQILESLLATIGHGLIALGLFDPQQDGVEFHATHLLSSVPSVHGLTIILPSYTGPLDPTKAPPPFAVVAAALLAVHRVRLAPIGTADSEDPDGWPLIVDLAHNVPSAHAKAQAAQALLPALECLGWTPGMDRDSLIALARAVPRADWVRDWIR